MIAKTFVALILFATFSTDGRAYEQATHALITARAFERSELFASDGISTLLRQLGLDTFEPFGRREAYFEVLTTSVSTVRLPRTPQSYETQMLSDIFGRSGISVSSERWLVYGAIREDDNPTEDPPTPQDVAPGLRRPLHHFYDPVFDRPLSSPFLAVIDSDVHKAIDWAIGSRNGFIDPNLPERPRRNSFTVLDARDAMFKALTLMANDSGTYVDIGADQTPITRQVWRQSYWATAFRALGDVLHVNQDMAQPQHTRNETHSGSYCPTANVCFSGHTSVYEKYIKARSLNDSTFDSLAPFNQPVRIATAQVPLDGYPIPNFGRYSDYWSTAPGMKQRQGKGLADYSNHGFFTAGKNFDSFEYPSPSTNFADYDVRTVIPTRWDGSAPSDTTPVHVYHGKVRDELQQTSATDVPLTTFGVWDQFLQAKSVPPAYSLNRLNYDAMADLLLPRAVAYSAGLINFFFRGRIDIRLPDEGVFALADHGVNKGFTTVRAKIGNVSPSFADAQNQTQLQNMRGGTFFAVVRYHTDKQYADSLEKVVGVAPCTEYSAVIDTTKLDASTDCRDGVEQIVVSKPLGGVVLDAGAETVAQFDFSESPIPFGMTDVLLQIVYRGPLGSEDDAVAVGTIDVSEPTYFTFHNASDYIHIGGHVYARPVVDNSPGLLADVRPSYCVDWQDSPPHLADGCLTEFPIDLSVSFENLAKPIAQVRQLPSRRFLRIAYLTTADEDFNPPVKAAARRVKVTVRRHDTDEKALLQQAGTCLPVDPFDIPPRHSQMTVFSPTKIGYRVDKLSRLRGINGWLNASCVVDGDNALPGTPDARVLELGPLNSKDEVVPYPVTLMPDYL